MTKTTITLTDRESSADELKEALLALYVALRNSAPKLSPEALRAFGNAREVLTRHGA